MQLDAFYAVLREVKAGELSEDEAMKRLERPPYWVWTAMEPERKLLLVMDVGTRTLEMAPRVVHQVAQVLAPGCVPLCFTNGLKDYGTALLSHFGHWMRPQRRHATGAMPTPRWRPLPELRSIQVVKSSRRRRIVEVKHRVICGTLDAVIHVLAACDWKINTACVERLNLDMRQRVAAVGRRVDTLYKGQDGLRQQLLLFQYSHNFCLPHASLRQPLPQPLPTKGVGSAKQWRPCTPGMRAGWTDRVWSLKKVLLFRVPPWPHLQMI